MRRWVAEVTYRVDGDVVIEVPFDLVELEDLQHFVERGPDFDTISEIRITRDPRTHPKTLAEVELE